MFNKLRNRLSKNIKVLNTAETLAEDPYLSAKCKIRFTVYFADGGFVIQSHTSTEDQDRDSSYSESLHIVTEFDQLSTKVQEILVRQAMELR